jgi:hypothetical protein
METEKVLREMNANANGHIGEISDHLAAAIGALGQAEQALSYVREDLGGQNLRIVDAAIKRARSILNPT